MLIFGDDWDIYVYFYCVKYEVDKCRYNMVFYRFFLLSLDFLNNRYVFCEILYKKQHKTQTLLVFFTLTYHLRKTYIQ